MVHASAAGSGSEFSKPATAVSIALHGIAVWLVIALAGHHPPAPPTPPITLADVEMIAEAPAAAPATPPPAMPPVSHKAGPRTGASVHGQREATQRTAPVAARTMQSLADVQVHYEDPTQFVDHEPAKLADVTTGVGPTGVGVTGVDVPSAQGGGSLARRPRPKHDYTNLRVGGASKFAGMTIRLRLLIDLHGKVSAVQILQGVDPDVDHRTIELAHKFEYEPALDDNGNPTAGSQRWEFQVVEDDEL